MNTTPNKYTFLKKVLCIVLSCLQIMTPELLNATAVLEESNTIHPKNFYSQYLKTLNSKNEKDVYGLTCHSLTPDQSGNFRLNFDSSFLQKNHDVVLTYKDRAIGTISYANKIFQLIGFSDTHFIVQCTQQNREFVDIEPTEFPATFLVQTQGHLTIKDCHFSDWALLQAPKISFEGQLKAGKGLIAQAFHECTIQGDVKAPVIEIKSKMFSHQGNLDSDNVYFEIENGEDSATSRIHSSQEIFINGFHQYKHNGSFAAKRSVITQGVSSINAKGSTTFAGLLQQFKGDCFQDNGYTTAWQRQIYARKILLDESSLFNGHYFVSQSEGPFSSVEIQKGASINVAMGISIQSAQRLSHQGSIAIRSNLIELPLWEYQKDPLTDQDLTRLEQEIGSFRQAYLPYFTPFSGVYMYTAGTFDVSTTGYVEAIGTSIHYTADHFTFAGQSQSGFLDDNHTIVEANQIHSTGIFNAPNQLRFEVGQKLMLDGFVSSSITAIRGGQNWIHGQLNGSIAISETEAVTIDGRLNGKFLSAQSQIFNIIPNTHLKFADLISITADQSNMCGELETKLFLLDAAIKVIGGKLTVGEKIILTGGNTRMHGHLQTRHLLSEEDKLELTGKTFAEHAHLKLKDSFHIAGETQIGSILGEAGNSITHTGTTRTAIAEFISPEKKISGTFIAKDFVKFSGGSTHSDANLTTKSLIVDESTFLLKGRAQAEFARFSGMHELTFADIVSIQTLVADTFQFSQRSLFNGGIATLTSKQGIFAALTTLSNNIQGDIQTLCITSPLYAKHTIFKSRTTEISNLVEVKDNAIFEATECLHITDKIQSGGDIFCKGDTSLAETGSLNATNKVQLEGNTHQLSGTIAGKVVNITATSVPELNYTSNTFKEVGELKLLFEKGGTFSVDLDTPAPLFLKGAEAIVVESKFNVPSLEADSPHIKFRSAQPLTLQFPVHVQKDLSLEAPTVTALKSLHANFVTINSPGNISLQDLCAGRHGITLNVGGEFNYAHFGLWTEGLLQITSTQPTLQLANSLTLPGQIKAQAPNIHIHANKELAVQKGCEFVATLQTNANSIQNHGTITSDGEIQYRGNLFLPQTGKIQTNNEIKVDGLLHQLHGQLQGQSATIKCPNIENLNFENGAFKNLRQLNLSFAQGGEFSKPLDIPGCLQIEFETSQTLTNKLKIKADQGLCFKMPGGTLCNSKQVIHMSGGYSAHPGGELLTLGLFEIQAANFNNLFGQVEAGNAWTNLTNKLFSNGAIVVHGTHVNDSRVTEIQRAQRVWTESKQFYYETGNKKNKTWISFTQNINCAECYPIHLSGLHQASALATQHTPALAQLLPQRPSSETPLAQEYHLTQGAHLVTGQDGTSLFTTRIIKTGANVEVRTIPIEINQKHLIESRLQEIKTINPARVESHGSITLNSPVISLQATELVSHAPVPLISVEATQRLEFPDFKIRQDEQPFIQKIKNVTYLIHGWHEDGMPTSFQANGGTVRLGHSSGSIEGVQPLIESAIQEILSPSVNLHQQTLNQGQICEVINVDVNRRKSNLASLASFVTGVILMASGIGSSAAAMVFAKGSTAAAMTQAAVVGLGSQFSGALIHCNGNIKRATKSVTTAGSLRGLTISVASAGMLNEIGTHFN